MRYNISNEATKDLENIWLYTFETWSVDQADRYYNLLMDEIEYIAQNPDSGKDYSHIRKGYWTTRVKSHFIFYKIDIVRSRIEIIRILHQQVDIDTRLND